MSILHFSDKYYSECCGEEMQDICHSFMKMMDVKKVDFARFNCLSRKVISLSTSPECQRFYFENCLYDHVVGFPNVGLKNIVSHDEVDKNSPYYQKYIKVVANEFDFDHTIVVIKFRLTYVDIFSFSVSSGNNNFHQFFLNNETLFEKFMLYFRHSAHSLIKRAKEKYSFSNPVPKGLKESSKHLRLFKKIFNTKIQKTEMIAATVNGLHGVEKNENDLNIKKYYLDEPFEDIYLTQREVDVLLLVYDTLQSKEIARTLGISVYTVNDHITNLRQKFQCQSKKELIKLIDRNDLCNQLTYLTNLNMPVAKAVKCFESWQSSQLNTIVEDDWTRILS